MVFSERLGKLVTRHWIVVLLGWLALVVVVHHFAPRWDDVTRDGDFAYLPDRMTSVRGNKLLAAAFPDYFSKSQVALVLARETGRITADDVAVADKLLAAFPASDDDSAATQDEGRAGRRRSTRPTRSPPSGVSERPSSAKNS